MTAAGAIGSLFVFSGRGSRREKNGAASDGDRQLAVAVMLASLAAIVVVLGSDLYEFSWRYQLPALVILPVAGTFGYMVVSRRVRGHLRSRPTAGRQG